jgi:hypothetical protein
MKKLTLQRETVRVLDHMDLANIRGGDAIISMPQTTKCHIGSGGACSGGSCVQTITPGTSVIDPGTSVIAPSGG